MAALRSRAGLAPETGDAAWRHLETPRITPASDQHRHVAAAPFLRLYLRRRLEEVGPVIVTLPLHQNDRGAQARLAWEQITSHDPITLLERLSELD